MTKEAIEVIKKEAHNGTVEELYLDDIQIPTISIELKNELEKLEDLMCLSLNNCGLTSLANFPTKSSLIRLEIMENKFPPKDLNYISKINTLQSLSLGSNKIGTIQDLEPLKNLENLIQLDLSETDLSKSPTYRKLVFELIPNLQVLDNLDSEGNEYEYSDDEDGEELEEGEEDDEGEEGENGDEEDDDEDDDDEEDDEEDDEGEEDEDDDEEDEDDEDDEVPQNKRRK